MALSVLYLNYHVSWAGLDWTGPERKDRTGSIIFLRYNYMFSSYFNRMIVKYDIARGNEQSTVVNTLNDNRIDAQSAPHSIA